MRDLDLQSYHVRPVLNHAVNEDYQMVHCMYEKTPSRKLAVNPCRRLHVDRHKGHKIDRLFAVVPVRLAAAKSFSNR